MMRKYEVSHLQKIGLCLLRIDDDRKTGLLLDKNRSLKECDLSGLVKWILRWLAVIWQSLQTISSSDSPKVPTSN